jgi:galactokinase
VLSEASRVLSVVKKCREDSKDDIDSPEFIGRLMNESHKSCSEMYECSSSELDALQKVCM